MTSDEEIMAQLSFYRGTLTSVIRKYMSAQQRQFLLDFTSRNRSDLTELWGHNPSVSQRAMLDEYKRFEFSLRQAMKLPKRNKSGIEQFHYVCIECDLTILNLNNDPICCPNCHSAKWLELVAF